MFSSVITQNLNWTVCRFKTDLGENKEVVFLRGVDTPMYTMCWLIFQCTLCVKGQEHMTSSTVTATGYFGYSTGSMVIQYSVFVIYPIQKTLKEQTQLIHLGEFTKHFLHSLQSNFIIS